MTPQRRRPKWIFAILTLVFIVLPALTVTGFVLFRSSSRFSDRVMEYMVTHMSEEDKQRYLAEIARDSPGIWTAIPEPRVGRVMRRNIRTTVRQTEVVSNNAGMRSAHDYVRKPEGVFRIICLGDSFVFGEGGLEEDRFGDQIEDILRELDVRPDGRTIEVYSLGLGSWTAVNEATYLTSRLTEYDPDLVLGLMTANDITLTHGILGEGQLTSTFSPEDRASGSGIFLSSWTSFFRERGYTFLTYGLGPTSEEQWRQAFAAWSRLDSLLNQRGRSMIFGVLSSSALMNELAKKYHAESGMTSPMIVTDFFGQRLEHDSHPNRAGHSTLAAHYLHAAAELDILPVDRDRLPPLHEDLALEFNPPADPEELDRSLRAIADRHLSEEIVFDKMTVDDVRAMLGGIHRGVGAEPLKVHPYGSLKSGFLLKRRPGSAEVAVEIQVLGRRELFPFHLRMEVNGIPSAELRLESIGEAGRYTLTGTIPERENSDIAIEIVLKTDSYWTTITVSTMRSYRLLRASQK